VQLSKKADMQQILKVAETLTLAQAKKWIRKRGLNEIPELINGLGGDNILSFLETIGFEKSLELMDTLGFEKLMDLVQKISHMKFPVYHREPKSHQKESRNTGRKIRALPHRN
jgi:hypothetical protein